MEVFSDEALVLDRHPYRDRDLILVTLTPHRGVVRGVLHRARGGKSTLGAATQILSAIKVTAHHKRHAELVTFRQIDLVESSYAIVGDLDRVAAASVVAELLLTFSPPGEPAERPFRLGRSALAALLAQRDPGGVVAYSQFWMLLLGGVLPPLDRCSECRRDLANEILWRPRDGQPACATCAPSGAERLEASSINHLVACRKLPMGEVPTSPPPVLSRWLDTLVRSEAERPLRALRFFRRHASA